jgi:hypothetical protein
MRRSIGHREGVTQEGREEPRRDAQESMTNLEVRRTSGQFWERCRGMPVAASQKKTRHLNLKCVPERAKPFDMQGRHLAFPSFYIRFVALDGFFAFPLGQLHLQSGRKFRGLSVLLARLAPKRNDHFQQQLGSGPERQSASRCFKVLPHYLPSTRLSPR